VTPDKFRSLALAIPEAIEGSHMGHADFRIQGKIFATLGYPDESSGMVKLSPEKQRAFIKKAPVAFAPCGGAWGKSGSTSVALAQAKIGVARAALQAASERLTAKSKPKPRPRS
jgi:hypothetical protein